MTRNSGASPRYCGSRGELLQAKGGPLEIHIAKELFLQSLDWAHRQEALSWELRTALSLSRRYQRQGLRREARDLLAPIYGRFIEGFETSDLRQAKALIEELRGEPTQLNLPYIAALYVGLELQLAGHVHKRDEGSGIHLAHDLAAVRFHRDLADTQFARRPACLGRPETTEDMTWRSRWLR